MVSSPPCPPSLARRIGTARGGWYYSCPYSGRLTSWYETGAWAPLVDSVDCISTSVSCPSPATWHCKSARGGLCYSKPRSGRLAPLYETGSGGGCLVLLIIGPTLHYWWHLHIVTSPQGQEKPHLGRRSALCSNNSKVRLMFIVYISNMFQQNIRSCK